MERLFLKMMEFYEGDPHQVQHLIKVHGFARLIGLGERLDEGTQRILEVAAIVHDIGIKPSLEKHGTAAGTYQELEGPPVAETMLKALDYAPEVVERVCYLVAHHHTYQDINGLDYQILVEADFLVNMYEGPMSAAAIQATLKNIFRTETGIRYGRLMFPGL